MRDELKTKITNALQNIDSEERAVFLLSKIRKYIEQNCNGKYANLKFFCDLALHAKIDRTQRFYAMLIDCTKHRGRFDLKPLFDDLATFLDEFDIPRLNNKNKKQNQEK